MKSSELLSSIEDKIPLAKHMGLDIVSCSLAEVSVAADFEKNRNHKMTAFGGSVATVLTLACWSWITNYLDEEGLAGYEVSIHKCSLEYLKPITNDFTGSCFGPESDLEQFDNMIERKSKGRITLSSFVRDPGGNTIVSFIGEFVAYKNKSKS